MYDVLHTKLSNIFLTAGKQEWKTSSHNLPFLASATLHHILISVSLSYIICFLKKISVYMYLSMCGYLHLEPSFH